VDAIGFLFISFAYIDRDDGVGEGAGVGAVVSGLYAEVLEDLREVIKMISWGSLHAVGLASLCAHLSSIVSFRDERK